MLIPSVLGSRTKNFHSALVPSPPPTGRRNLSHHVQFSVSIPECRNEPHTWGMVFIFLLLLLSLDSFLQSSLDLIHGLLPHRCYTNASEPDALAEQNKGEAKSTFLFAHSGLGTEIKSRSVVSNSLWPRGLYSPWDSPGQSTGVGSLSLLQGIFPTQGSNPGLPHCRWILYQLSHKGSACGFSPLWEQRRPVIEKGSLGPFL